MHNFFRPFMTHARTLALRGRWHTAPNPMVGAVLVHEGKVVAEGWHAQYGGAHAERACLEDARQKGVQAADCTLVVTLEPCCHTGKTLPCTDAILEAGIRHVVVGIADPNPVAKGGAKVLQDAGVQVDMGIDEEACRELVQDFFVWQTTSRPYTMLKLASSLDGRIATRTGESKWISCQESRQRVHELRAHVGQAGGAVLVGGNTFHMDDPLLTARGIPVTRQPLAAVLTTRLPTTNTVNLLAQRAQETVIFTTAANAASLRAHELLALGVRVVGLSAWRSPHGEDISQALEWLRQECGCHYVLCEGGGQFGLSMLRGGFVDEMHLFLAPMLLADNQARPVADGLFPLHINEALHFTLQHMDRCGDDCHLTFRPKN